MIEDKEYWISWKDRKRFIADRIFMFTPLSRRLDHGLTESQEVTHVIEKSEYDALKAENEKLRATLAERPVIRLGQSLEEFKPIYQAWYRSALLDGGES